MRQQYHQSEEVDISRTEILLLIINVLIIVSGIIYFISNWNHIPDNIFIFNKKHNRWDGWTKLSYFFSIFLSSFPFLVFSIAIVKNKRIVDNTFLKRRKVSSDLLNAKKQLLVERRCYLYGFAILQTSVFIGYILQIQRQLKTPFMPSEINVGSFFLVAIIINWLLHHIVWNKFADK